jgi:hypothetical protein
MAINDLYNDHERRLDTVMGRAQFWAAMRECRDGEGQEHCRTAHDMIQWFREIYGIELQWSDEYVASIKPEVVIVDESKYMIFLLKYTR